MKGIKVPIDFLVRYFHYFINSIIYIFIKSPIYLNAWVEVRFGKVKNNNWGDDINVFLLEKITNRKIIIRNQSLFHRISSYTNYICIGSILGWYENDKSEIWGAGFISNDSKIFLNPTKIHSVRGKLTRKKLIELGIDCPKVYGDPALLVSKYYKPSKVGKYKIGIVPHYTDFDNPIVDEFLSKNPDCLKIDMKNYTLWTDLLDQIYSCDVILSSSLHGLIVADSYGIPNVWVSFSNKIKGGNFKYLDYFSSVNRTEELPYYIKKIEDLQAVHNNIYNIKNTAEIDFDSIISSCPFII